METVPKALICKVPEVTFLNRSDYVQSTCKVHILSPVAFTAVHLNILNKSFLEHNNTDQNWPQEFLQSVLHVTLSVAITSIEKRKKRIELLSLLYNLMVVKSDFWTNDSSNLDRAHTDWSQF